MENRNSSRLTIILGAGASHDCADQSTAAQVNDKYRPPLMRYIFSANFDEILSHYPTITARLDELRTKLAKDGNFEEIFRALLDSAERHKNYWPLQIPLYLRELFWTVSLVHLQGSSKFDTLVRRVLESSLEKIMFLNLNYDLLLETALKNYDHHTFDGLSSYAPQSKKWLYVKPHGSVHWARILKNCPVDGSGTLRPSLLQEMPIFSSELTLVMWNRQSHDFYIPGGGPPGYLYPQIVVPTDKPKDFVCPQQHIDEARTFLQSCGNFLLIGFSGRDDDVVNLLRGIPARSQLAIVSKGEARTILNRINSRVPSLRSKKLVVSFHNIGFSKFLESKAFEKFCEKFSGGESVSGMKKGSSGRNG